MSSGQFRHCVLCPAYCHRQLFPSLLLIISIIRVQLPPLWLAMAVAYRIFFSVYLFHAMLTIYANYNSPKLALIFNYLARCVRACLCSTQYCTERINRCNDIENSRLAHLSYSSLDNEGYLHN